MKIEEKDGILPARTDAKELIDVGKMSADDKKRVKEIVEQINLDDTNAVIQYGVGAQSGISSFSDTVLSEVRSKDSGYVGEQLTSLMFCRQFLVNDCFKIRKRKRPNQDSAVDHERRRAIQSSAGGGIGVGLYLA